MDNLELLWGKIENKIYSKSAFLAMILLMLIIFFAGDHFFSKYISSKYLVWGYIILPILWTIYWLLNYFYIPRNKKNKTGLVLCIHADSEEAEKNLKRDFIDTLKKQISNENIGNIFNIITIKNHLACKYNNFENIKKLHKRTNSHIYIFGETKKRKNGKDQYFLLLDGMVLHRPVEKQVSQELSKDFLSVLPKRINFNDEFEFAGFQISADIVLKSVKYIIGVASFISGNPYLSIQLHTNLKEQIKLSQQKLPWDNVFLNKIDNLLADEHAMVATYYLIKENKTKTIENLKISLSLNPNCYKSLIVESLIAFSWDNNSDKSLDILKKCHGFSFPEWRYNEAFLYFWLGNYQSALKQCEKIKNQNYSNEVTTSLEVTNFNEDLLSSNDNKPALYFWLGYNYYYKQNNLPLALKSFENFENKADNTMNILKQKSSAWLVEIKQKMGNIK